MTGADRQVARLTKDILGSGGTLPPIIHTPSKYDTWSGTSPEWRAERTARRVEAMRARAKTPAELRPDQLYAQRAKTLAEDPQYRRKLAEGVRSSWTPERREAEREVGRQKWAKFGDRVIEGMLDSWDSYTGRLAHPKKLWFDPNFTLEQLAAMVSVLARGGNSMVSARRAECPRTWSSARA
jgi:hypothetical protein